MGQLAVLARLLVPEDYGLMAMVSVVLGYAGLFTDFGVNSAFIQRQDVTAEQRSSLYWFNVLVSGCLTLVVVAISPLAAHFFGDLRLAPLMMLSAMTFTFGAIGGQVRMAAEKELNFRSLAILDTSSLLLGVIVAVLAALAGWGVYALVTAGIVTAVSATLLAWGMLAKGWRPMWRMRLVEIRPFLRFGGALVANNLVNQFNSTVDLFLGGRLLTTVELGFYSVPRSLALQIQSMANPIITRIGFPLIARVRSDIERVRNIYLKTLNMTASTNAPIYVGMAFFAPDIIAILLGTKWGRAGDILRILALWGGVRSTFNPLGSLLLGMGRADLSLKWNVALLLIVLPAVWIGSMSGPTGIAWAMFVLLVGLFIPGWYWLVRPMCRATLSEYSIAALRPFVIATAAVLPGYWLSASLEGATPRLLAGVAVAAPLYLALSHWGNREWTTSMQELAGLRRS